MSGFNLDNITSFFKSAINKPGDGVKKNLSSGGYLTIGGKTVKEGPILSEGGYGYIMKCYDANTNQPYVLKKSICQNKERYEVAEAELKFLSTVPQNDFIVKCYGIHQEKQGENMVCYALLELMQQGSLFDYMEKKQHVKFSESEILAIFRQICEGIKIMHSMNPPLAHRDLKIENVLFNGKRFKLCDFGSVSSEVVDFRSVPKSLHEEKMAIFERRTTVTYRAPEMCDPFLQFKVDVKADIWMLGCCLFAMAFFKHPFQDCTTLSIANASYYLPEKHKYTKKFENLIRNLLTPNPKNRMDIFQLIKLLDNWDLTSNILLNPDAQKIKMEHVKRDSILNNDAWARINAKDPMLGGTGEISLEEMTKALKEPQGNYTQNGIKQAQFRAQFAEFNVRELNIIGNKARNAGENLNNPYKEQFKNDQNPNFDFSNWGNQTTNCQNSSQMTLKNDPFGDFNFDKLEQNTSQKKEINLRNGASFNTLKNDVFAQFNHNQAQNLNYNDNNAWADFDNFGTNIDFNNQKNEKKPPNLNSELLSLGLEPEISESKAEQNIQNKNPFSFQQGIVEEEAIKDPNHLLSLGLEEEKIEQKCQIFPPENTPPIPNEPKIQTVESTSTNAGLLDLQI